MVLFRLRGVPVIVGWSWLVILGLVFWSLGWSVFPSGYPRLSTPTYVVMAAVTALLFFASVLAHELSHTLTTLREGVRVREIRLWLFGGVSAAEDPLPGPGAEFRVVAAGPATTAVLAGAFLGLAALARAVGASTPWIAVPDYLAWLNGLLLGFNLVPALPLDGGRLLHALLWWRSRDTDAATVYAGVAGRAFALVLIAIGLVAMLTGNSLGGLWFVVIGWFLLQSVRQEVLAARAAHAFAGVRVRQLMTPAPTTLDPEMSVEELGDLLGRGAGHLVYPVVEEGRLTGMLLVRDAGAVPVAERARHRIGSLMQRRDVVPVVDADAPASAAVALLRKAPGRALVTERPAGDTVVGVVAPSDLTRALETSGPGRWPGRGPGRWPGRWPGRGNRTALAIGVAATLAVLVGAAALWHPPLAVVSPGPALDVSTGIRLAGVPSQPVHGRYLATPVQLSQPSALGLAVALARGGGRVLPVSAVLPVGTSAGALSFWQRASARETGLAAAVAAARTRGLAASLTGAGVRVVGLVGDTATAGSLRVGDRITAVDRTPVGTATDLAATVAAAPGQDRFAVTALRAGRLIRVQVARVSASPAPGLDALGLLGTSVDLRASLPFRVTYGSAASGLGPSAGLALALAVTDRLDPADLAHGRAVAAAGLVAADGRLGPPGALDQRVAAARTAGADAFLAAGAVPASVAHGPVPLSGATTLREAVSTLASTP